MKIRPYRDDDLGQIGEVHAVSRHAAYVGLVTPEALARITPQTQAEAWRGRLLREASPWAMLVGHLLHDHIVRQFRAWNCSSAQLWVLAGNVPAQRFYRRHGWSLGNGRDTNDIGGALVPTVQYGLSLTADCRAQ
jgi:hypothetical protein